MTTESRAPRRVDSTRTAEAKHRTITRRQQRALKQATR